MFSILLGVALSCVTFSTLVALPGELLCIPWSLATTAILILKHWGFLPPLTILPTCHCLGSVWGLSSVPFVYLVSVWLRTGTEAGQTFPSTVGTRTSSSATSSVVPRATHTRLVWTEPAPALLNVRTLNPRAFLCFWSLFLSREQPGQKS